MARMRVIDAGGFGARRVDGLLDCGLGGFGLPGVPDGDEPALPDDAEVGEILRFFGG